MREGGSIPMIIPPVFPYFKIIWLVEADMEKDDEH